MEVACRPIGEACEVQYVAAASARAMCSSNHAWCWRISLSASVYERTAAAKSLAWKRVLPASFSRSAAGSSDRHHLCVPRAASAQARHTDATSRVRSMPSTVNTCCITSIDRMARSASPVSIGRLRCLAVCARVAASAAPQSPISRRAARRPPSRVATNQARARAWGWAAAKWCAWCASRGLLAVSAHLDR